MEGTTIWIVFWKNWLWRRGSDLGSVCVRMKRTSFLLERIGLQLCMYILYGELGDDASTIYEKRISMYV